MEILIWIFIVIILVIVLIDIIPIIYTWISRIHIGRYNDEKVWREALIKKSIKWLNSTPKIKVTDSTRLTIIDRLKGNYTKSAIQYWQQASLILGLNECNDNRDKINNAINQYLQKHFDCNGQWREKPQFVDGAILSYAIMNLDDSNKYKQSFDYTYKLIKELIGDDGTVKYRKSMPNYRYVDTIGFISPFLIKYGVIYNDNEAIELGVNQITEYFKYGFDNEKIIPFHAYDIKEKFKLGLCGWGRGLGWFAIGIIDSWIELPESSKHKKKLEEIIIKLAKSIIKLQQYNGGWGWTVSRKETRVDSSTTAIFAWYLLNASNIKIISEECRNAMDKALGYLITVTRKNGIVDFSQGDTKDIGVYSMLFDILPFTQGCTLRTISKL